MTENSILGGMIALPLLLTFALLFFFRAVRRRPEPARWPHLLAGNALVLVFLCSIVLLAGEIYYRFLYDTTESFGLSKTTTRWFERHFHRNAAGFRDSIDYWYSSLPGQRRVTFIGDSFTAGHGVPEVEDRFANRFRAMGVANEVHVLAQCGFDTGHELAMFDSMLAAGHYDYDIVVLVYCLNDISDIVPEWKDMLRRIYHSPTPGALFEESYFLNVYYCRYRAARDPAVSDYYGFIIDAYQGEIWEHQRERLTRLRNGIEAQGGRLLVVTFPFLHALGPNYRYQFVHDQLAEHWAELGVPHFDLLSTFESSDPAELIVNPRDVHPNEAAHAMAADAIAEFVEPYLEPPPADGSDASQSNVAPAESTER